MVQAQFEDRIRLAIAELVLRDQFLLGTLSILGSPDDFHEVIKVIEGLFISLQNVGPIFRDPKVKLCAANDHFPPMLEITEKHLAHGQQLWTPPIERQHDHPKTTLQRGVLVEVVDDHLGNRIPLELEHNADGFIRLIAGVTDPIQLLFLHQFRHPFDQLLWIDIVGHLGDHQLGLPRASVLHGYLSA